MQGPGLRVVASVFLAGIFSMSLSAPDTSEKTAVPGTVNYVEGQVSIGSEALNSKSIGSTQLETNQTLTTQNGKAEILLTPGVFLRVGSDSTVKMISPGLANTDVGLEKGHAMVEVAEIHPQNDIRISANDATTTLRKTGLYDFDLRQSELRVFDGEASVLEGDQHTDVKGGHKISLNNVGGKLKSQKFDKRQYETDDLYRWSSLRSAYLAEANVNAARIYVEDGWGPWGPGWWGADWYWNPWFDTFTFIPGDGIFYSPFGWGFYSPWWVSQAPFYGYAGGRPPDYRHFSTDPHNWGPGPHYAEGSNYTGGIYHGPGAPAGGGFHSGPGTSGGGGLGGEGFHGGGFHGGGFHGGVGFSGGGGFHGR